MPKILIFIDWFIPGYKAGGPISSNANLINHLSNEFDFYVLTRDTDYCEKVPYKNIISDTWNTLPNGAKVYYISNKSLTFKTIIRIVRSIEFDYVYINGLYSKYFSIFPLLYFKYFTNKKIVVSSRGMLSDHSFSSKKSKKKIFYFFGSVLNLYKNIVFHATNNEEANQIKKNLKYNGKIKVAPNLAPKNNSEYEAKHKESGVLNIISIARISEEKNTLFALEVLKKCNAQQINFDLYGTIYNEAYWADCLKIIDSLPSHIKVNYKGTIDKAQIPIVLNNYHCLLMPSLGENYGHAIIESFMVGCPVIISDRTPWRNLQNLQTTNNEQQITKEVGWDLPLENPETFVKAIEQCTKMNQEEYNKISRDAWEFAQIIINDPKVLEANRKLFID